MCGNQLTQLCDLIQLNSTFFRSFQWILLRIYLHQEGCTDNHQFAKTIYE